MARFFSRFTRVSSRRQDVSTQRFDRQQSTDLAQCLRNQKTLRRATEPPSRRASGELPPATPRRSPLSDPPARPGFGLKPTWLAAWLAGQAMPSRAQPRSPNSFFRFRPPQRKSSRRVRTYRGVPTAILCTVWQGIREKGIDFSGKNKKYLGNFLLKKK